jgi:hypothetical protein
MQFKNMLRLGVHVGVRVYMKVILTPILRVILRFPLLHYASGESKTSK